MHKHVHNPNHNLSTQARCVGEVATVISWNDGEKHRQWPLVLVAYAAPGWRGVFRHWPRGRPAELTAGHIERLATEATVRSRRRLFGAHAA